VDLQRALAGEIGFSASLEALAQSMFNGQLPAAWARLNPATEKGLGSWMTWFRRRYEQYKDWVDNGEPKVGELAVWQGAASSAVRCALLVPDVAGMLGSAQDSIVRVMRCMLVCNSCR
jgi:hypothetical protein